MPPPQSAKFQTGVAIGAGTGTGTGTGIGVEQVVNVEIDPLLVTLNALPDPELPVSLK